MVKKKMVKKAKGSQKPFWTVLLIVSIVLAGVFLMRKSNQVPPVTNTVAINPTAFDFGNQKIMLNNQELAFANGAYVDPNTIYGKHTAMIENRSVNPSGTRAAAILVDSPGGSGTFYYLVGAMLEDGKETYSEPVMLGDRIKIVVVNVDDPGAEDNGVITVQSLDRQANAPMATKPTLEMTMKYAFQEDGNLIGVLH